MALQEKIRSMFSGLAGVFGRLLAVFRRKKGADAPATPSLDEELGGAASEASPFDEPLPPQEVPSVFGRFGKSAKTAVAAVGKGEGKKSRMLLGLSVLFLGAGVLALLVFWRMGSGRGGAMGPQLKKMTSYEEFFYCPLGFPLGGAKAQAELRMLGALQPSPSGGNSFRISSGDLVHLRGNGFEAFFLDRGETIEPRQLRVESGRIGVKWGIRIGEQTDVARFLLGEPATTSADVSVYRDRWGSEVLLQMRSDRIVSIEWRFPSGLRIE